MSSGWAFAARAAAPAQKRAAETYVHDGLHYVPFRPAEPGGIPATPATAVTLPAVWSCVETITTTVLQLRLAARQYGTYSPLPTWLRRPETLNGNTARLRTILEHLVVSQALHGAGYLWADVDSGDSWALQVVSPHRVAVELIGDTRTYRLDGRPVPLARRWATRPNEAGLVVVNHRTLPGVAAGVGPIQAARLALSGYLDTDAYGADVFGQGIPQGLLETDQEITAATAERYQERWMDGADKPVRVLGNGFRFTPFRLAPKDAAWLEARRWNAEEVARLYLVPAYKLNLAQAGGLTYTNAQDLDRAYLRDCITGYTGPIEDALDALTPPGRSAEDEYQVRFAAYAEGVAAGWLTDMVPATDPALEVPQ